MGVCRLYLYDNTPGLFRHDEYELPTWGIQEMIANAVVHRSYFDPGMVQVAIYDDRLEVTSPGMLIGGLSLSDIKSGRSQPRNRGIAEAFTYTHIMDMWGSGIPRLFDECKAGGLPMPEIIELGGSFRINMFRNTELSGHVSSQDADITIGNGDLVQDDSIVQDSAQDRAQDNASSSPIVQDSRQDNCTVQVGEHDNEQVIKDKLLLFCAVPRSRTEISAFCKYKSVRYLTRLFIKPLIEEGLLQMTLPDKPTSRNQKYIASSSK